MEEEKKRADRDECQKARRKYVEKCRAEGAEPMSAAEFRKAWEAKAARKARREAAKADKGDAPKKGCGCAKDVMETANALVSDFGDEDAVRVAFGLMMAGTALLHFLAVKNGEGPKGKARKGK